MSGFAKSPELSPNPFLGRGRSSVKTRWQRPGRLILLTGVVRRRRSLVSP
jgi:hypothetical protein